MKGFVPTPPSVVDTMVAKLFRHDPPRPENVVLDPGCGTGAFIDGVIRWCSRHAASVPRLLGVESDPTHLLEARKHFGQFKPVTLVNEDFLSPRSQKFTHIIGNPPYVPITALSHIERLAYRERYATATGRFDLYLLFFEQALKLLAPGGRLVFITPEKFLYVRTAEPLRRMLAKVMIEEVHFVSETTFGALVTYPTITTIVNRPARNGTKVILRDGSSRRVRLAADGSSWLPAINGRIADPPGHRLADVSLRISCGVATGADKVYVAKASHLTTQLRPFALPTVAGREIGPGRGLTVSHAMLLPYARSGELLREDELGDLGVYLSQPERRHKLLNRTCAAHKRWYAFHENPPLGDILRPKILCKDIASRPFFLVDDVGEIVPRHSVYYIVPKDVSHLQGLCEYLNSPAAGTWLTANCQRAANGFLRLQSHVLKRMPVPAEFVRATQLS